ncbi:MAG: hypothetical protein WCS89_01310 [Candidatus Paceibacterota bacterium]
MKKLIDTMITIFIVTILASLALDVRGAGSTSSIVIDSSGLPNKLPMGDESTFKSYIVGKNNLGMNVWVSLGFQNDNDNWTPSSCGKFSYGYDSYDDFLNDVTNAAVKVLERYYTNGIAYPPGRKLYAMLEVTYFNDRPDTPSYPIGLWVYREVGTLEMVTPMTFKEVFSLPSTATTNLVEKAVIAIPALEYLNITVEMPTGVGTFSWSNSVVKTSALWPSNPSNQTRPGYLSMDKWLCVGNYPARITIRTTNGSLAVYTHYGDRIKPPKMSMPDSKNLAINTPRGSNTKIFSSTDLKNWTLFGTTNSGGVNNITLPVNGNGKTFYKASCE